MNTSENRIRVGPAGWSYPDWEGVVYPGDMDRGFDRLEYIASRFDLIEINSTFYRTPARATCRGWAERVSARPDFLFTAKAPREITHGSQGAPDEAIAAFKIAVEPLFDRGRLGAVLVQFPWSFRPTKERIAYVKNVTDLLRPLRAAVEVRHGEWGAPPITAFFRDNGIALCGIDQPLIGNSLRPDVHVAADDIAYFRLHGRRRDKWFGENTSRDERYDYLYDASELSPWSERIRAAAVKTPRVFAVLNNHFRGQAVVNALELQTMLTGNQARAPRSLLAKYPRARAVLAEEEEKPARKGGPGDQLGLFEERDDDQ
ncbi:MAG: hypothetical protein H6Q78_837 [Candidatus Krumholzibacteriota bacterium]|nr:hypothetical protein [Candidatus Krumholzibacteriota bacterium]